MRKYTNLLIIIISTIALLFFIHKTVNFILEDTKDTILQESSNKAKKLLKQMIDDKQSNTDIIASLLATSNEIKSSLLNNNNSLDLKEISIALREKTKYKNVWLHLIDKDGISIQRSWIKNRGDSVVSKRLDVASMIKNPRIISNISTGIFDMTFKSMVPIYNENDKYIGHIEAITHFNSIAKSMKKSGYELMVFVDKHYREQIKKPFSEIFIEDYYVTLLSPSSSLTETIKQYGVSEFLFIDNYKKIDNNLYSYYSIKDLAGKEMGHFIISRDYNSINFEKLYNTKQNILFLTLLVILLIIIYGSLYIFHNKKIKKQSRFYKDILDLSADIIIVSGGDKILSANRTFFKFFSQFSLNSNLSKNDICICDFFKNKQENLSSKKEFSLWLHKIATNERAEQKVFIDKDDKEHIFNLKATPLINHAGEKEFVIVLSDITDIENYNKNLQTEISEKIKEVEERDQILIQNSKISGMGEIINAIAHQWRQPLNSIGLEVEVLVDDYNYNELNKEEIENFREKVMKKIRTMSSTIDNFLHFFKNTDSQELFNAIKVTYKASDLLLAKMKNYNIELIHNPQTEEDCYVYGNRNQYVQVVHNILSNSIDAIDSEKNNHHGVITINYTLIEDTLKIEFIDNGIGMKEEELEKMFEPYFSTKAKSGKGIGLFMSKNIIENKLLGIMHAKNYQDGFIVEITLPVKKHLKQ